MKTIGERIKAFREARGLTLRQLDDLSGVPFGTIARYEKNEYFPGLMNLIALADALELSLDDLVGRGSGRLE